MEQENEEIVKVPYKRKSRAKCKVIEETQEVNDEPIDETIIEEIHHHKMMKPLILSECLEKEYDPFLDELCKDETENIVFTQEPIKKPRKSRSKKLDKHEPQEHKNINDMDNDELYADDATPILGKDRLQIIKKIESYKVLFKDELKNFKLAKNPSIDMLEMALTEIETIIELGTIDSFITDSIIQCIKLAEGASSYTKYNISGLSGLLKENKQFHSLLKLLYLKHQVFSEVPPEYQLLLLVGTTSILCVQKNASKNQMNDRLNEPMVF